MIINHGGYECDVVFGSYGSGNNGIQLVGKQGTEYEGELIAVASVNGEERLPKNLVGIKTWSENEGIVKSLIDGNVIESELLGLEPTGFVAIEYYKLTEESLDEIERKIKQRPTDGNQ